jgi:hypothetical protein
VLAMPFAAWAAPGKQSTNTGAKGAIVVPEQLAHRNTFSLRCGSRIPM